MTDSMQPNHVPPEPLHEPPATNAPEVISWRDAVRPCDVEYRILPVLAFWWPDHCTSFPSRPGNSVNLACVEDVFVHHFGETSFDELYASGKHSEIFTANHARFVKNWGAEWSGNESRETAEYRDLIAHIHAAVLATTPRDAHVMAVSNGNPSFADISGRRASHFLQDDTGTFTGFYPAKIVEANAHIEASHTKGVEHRLFSARLRWRLDHYAEMRRHLDKTAAVRGRIGADV